MTIKRRPEADLIIADSERDADMLYATGIFVPDPFIYYKTRAGSAVVMSDLEIGRAKKKARVKRVLSISRLMEQIRKSEKITENETIAVITHLFKKEGIEAIRVPGNFPIRFADPLRKRFALRFEEGPFFEKRAAKDSREVQYLKKSVRAAKKGFEAALKIVRDSSIGDNNRLYLNGKVLKSENLRMAINSTITSMGYSISHTIVACGNQGCDPHNEGYGPLKARQPIIIDIFPRSDATGYYGDFTRTVVKGKAHDRVKRAYRLVRDAQQIAFKMIAHGRDGNDVHQAILRLFEEGGFPNRDGKRGREGFIHGTGHGLGLDIHEYPRINGRSSILKAGNVVTVEPGLYYHGMGGVRLEDVVVVTRDGCRNITKCPRRLEIE